MGQQECNEAPQRDVQNPAPGEEQPPAPGHADSFSPASLLTCKEVLRHFLTLCCHSYPLPKPNPTMI